MSVACELNLVSDAVVIGDKYSHNIEEMNGLYTSEDGIEHRLYNLSDNLDFELVPMIFLIFLFRSHTVE